MKKYRYALDQTFTKNQTLEFLKNIALKHNIVAYGYYKGNGKTETEVLEFDAPRFNKVVDIKLGRY